MRATRLIPIWSGVTGSSTKALAASLQPVEASDGVIVIRAPRLEDAADHQEAVLESLDDLMPWLPWGHPGYAREDSHEWIERSIEGWRTALSMEFVVLSAHTGRFFGAVGMNRVDPVFRKANLGYWIRRSETGHGYAAAATVLAARAAFESFGLERIEIIADVANIRSQRVAEKAGAKREGVLRNGIRMGDRQADAVSFSLIPTDLS